MPPFGDGFKADGDMLPVPVCHGGFAVNGIVALGIICPPVRTPAFFSGEGTFQHGTAQKRKGARQFADFLNENTVILYASDHGSHFKTRNRDAHLNGYDDYKRSCHDGCLHVPLVICGGPFKGGKEVTELVSTESIPKTLLALAGVDVGDKMIGENLLDVVEKKNHNRANEVYAQISESRCGRCIRTADYMYSVYAPGVNGGEAAASDVYADDFLYDMQKDPWQLNNVVADPAYADVKAELRERLLNWIQHAEGTRPTITD